MKRVRQTILFAAIGAVAMVSLAREAGAQAAPAAAPVAPGAASAAAPEIRILGEADQKLHLVDHGGGKWSMHAENIASTNLLRLWQEAGGPEFDTKASIDRQYTLSFHKLSSERVIDRLLEGFNYTLHYDKGRLTRVRVYSPQQSFVFKTARLVESLGKWREAETSPGGPTETVDEPVPAPLGEPQP
jgi:hypothetical protein